MSCQPYNSTSTARERRRPRRFALRRPTLVVLTVCSLALGRSADAQWICGPTWGPPMTGQTVNGMPYAQQPSIIVGPAYAQTGPALPPIIIDESPSTITSYPPSETVLPPFEEGATSCLDEICGHLRVVIPEAFLNRMLARNDTDAGPVTDFILGANVTGSQNTETCLTVDVQPSDRTARLLLQLNGTTVNQTIGVTSQAAVRSRGNHQFTMTKQIDFDGLKFTTRSPSAWVTPQLTNERAQTMLSSVPLLGQVANQIALREAERRRPEAEQIITQRVTQQAAPRFNSEVDQQLAEANIALRGFAPYALGMVGLSPANVATASNDHSLLYGLNVPRSASPSLGPALTIQSLDIGAAGTVHDDSDLTVIRQIGHPVEHERIAVESRPFRPPPIVVDGNALTIAVHEDMVQHLLEQMPLGGMEVPDRTIDRVIEMLMQVLDGLSLNELSIDGIGSEQPEFATIVLAEDDSLSVRFENGQVIVTAHAGFRPLLAPIVPTQRVEIPFTLTNENGQLSLVPGEVTVESLAQTPESPIVELARPIIRQQIAQRLQSISMSSSLPLAVPGMPPTTLTVRDVTLADGWLVLSID